MAAADFFRIAFLFMLGAGGVIVLIGLGYMWMAGLHGEKAALAGAIFLTLFLVSLGGFLLTNQP